MPSVNVTERSVDTIQSIYAVVIALAISEATQVLLTNVDGRADLRTAWLLSGAPAFVAFLVTLVPFWHGMNRHLDRCYLEKSQDVVQGAILFDFATFLVEAAVLFAAGLSLRSGIDTFVCVGLLLAIDMVWAWMSHQIHFPGDPSHARRWSAVNVVSIALAGLVIAFPFEAKPLVLVGLAILRSIVDYWWCWDFYFPPLAPKLGKTAGSRGVTAPDMESMPPQRL